MIDKNEPTVSRIQVTENYPAEFLKKGIPYIILWMTFIVCITCIVASILLGALPSLGLYKINWPSWIQNNQMLWRLIR